MIQTGLFVTRVKNWFRQSTVTLALQLVRGKNLTGIVAWGGLVFLFVGGGGRLLGWGRGREPE